MLSKTKPLEFGLVTYFSDVKLVPTRREKEQTVIKSKKKTEYVNPKLIPEVSKTGDVLTNDFDLVTDKMPALSTIGTQIRNAKLLLIQLAHFL